MRQLLQQLTQPAQRVVGVFACLPDHLHGFLVDLPETPLVLPLLPRGATFALDDVGVYEAVKPLHDRQRLGHADAVTSRRGPLRVPDETLQRAAEAHLVVREIHAHTGLGIRDEGHLIEWSEAVEKPGCRIEDRPERTGPDVHLIDRQHDPSPVRRRQVAGIETLRLVNLRLSRGLNVDLDQIGGDHAPCFPIDLHHEVRREQIVDRSSVPIHDRDVHSNEIDTRAEPGALDRLRRLRGLRCWLFLRRDEREGGHDARGDGQ